LSLSFSDCDLQRTRNSEESNPFFSVKLRSAYLSEQIFRNLSLLKEIKSIRYWVQSKQCKTFVNNYAGTSVWRTVEREWERKREREKERERERERKKSFSEISISLKNEVPCIFFRPTESIWTVKRYDHVRGVIYPQYFISCHCLYMAIEVCPNEIWEQFRIRWFCHFQDLRYSQICDQIKKEWSVQVISIRYYIVALLVLSLLIDKQNFTYQDNVGHVDR